MDVYNANAASGIFGTIPFEWREQDPTADTFPQVFNPSAKDIWTECVDEVHLNTNLNTYEERWAACIDLFVNTCNAKQRAAFVDINAEEVNDRIFDAVKEQYRELCSLLPRLFYAVQVSITENKPSCYINDQTFHIQLSYKLDHCQNAPEFEAFLTEEAGFTKIDDGFFTYNAPKTETITVIDKTMQDVEVKNYEIRAVISYDALPIIAERYSPSQKELSDFILNVLLVTVEGLSNPML